MADELKRTTSHAKSVEGLYQEENALDRARALKEDFERAVNEQAREKTRPQERTSETPSSSGYAPKPEMHLRPDGPARRAVDRAIDNKQRSKENKLSQEAQRALDLAKDFKQAKQKNPRMDHQKTRHHGR